MNHDPYSIVHLPGAIYFVRESELLKREAKIDQAILSPWARRLALRAEHMKLASLPPAGEA